MFQFFYILWENYELYLYIIHAFVEWDRGQIMIQFSYIRW